MQDILFIGYKRCNTSNKAEAFLKNHGIEYVFRDIKDNKPSEQEIKKFHETSGLDIKKLFNTSGKLYKEGKVKDKLPNMTLKEKYEMLSSDGLFVKRPIVVLKDKVLVGFKEEEWIKAFDLKENK